LDFIETLGIKVLIFLELCFYSFEVFFDGIN